MNTRELRRLLSEASPERWVDGEEREDGTAMVYRPNNGPLRVVVPVAETTASDARLIAALRNAAPALLDVVEAAEALLEAGDNDVGEDEGMRTVDALRAALEALHGKEGRE